MAKAVPDRRSPVDMLNSERIAASTIVEPGERDEEAYRKHRGRNCIADRRDDGQSMNQL
jgi:hypothetical protein